MLGIFHCSLYLLKGTLFHCVLWAAEAVCKRNGEVETNNPLAQKKNTGIQPRQQLEPHRALSYSCIHSFAQEVWLLNMSQLLDWGLQGELIKTSPCCWEAHSAARETDAQIVSGTKWKVLQQLREYCHYFLGEGERFIGGESLGIKEEKGHTLPPSPCSNNMRWESAGLGREITRYCSSPMVVLP